MAAKKCEIEEHLKIPDISCEFQRDIYFEVEEDAWEEGGSRKKGVELVSDPEWIGKEVHDIALKNKFTDEQKNKLHRFLTEYFVCPK